MFHKARVYWPNDQKEEIVRKLQALDKPLNKKELTDIVIMLDLWCNQKDLFESNGEYVSGVAEYLKKVDASILDQQYQGELKYLLETSVPAFLQRVAGSSPSLK